MSRKLTAYFFVCIFAALTAQADFVQFDPIANSVAVQNQPRLQKRAVTFFCPVSQSPSAAQCLSKAVAKLSKSCLLQNETASNSCILRVLNNSDQPRIRLVDEWWCSIDSDDCVTSTSACEHGFAQLPSQTSREVAFFKNVCRKPPASPNTRPTSAAGTVDK